MAICLECYPQSTEDSLIARLGLNNRHLPADQVFLHTDRNIYYPGDTLRFHAYVRDRQTGIYETASISLYAMLLNDKHQTIDSARFRINNSTASGWLKVPDEIPEGHCSLISFTSRMMNFDPEFVFSAPVRIDKKRAFRSQSTKGKGERDTLEYLRDEEPQKIDLRFLPEGGTFVYGIKQRIAFNAVLSNGSSIKCTGKIFNQQGEPVVNFSSGMFSPGLIEFTPHTGETYFAVLNGDENDGIRWPLPIPLNSGVALRINKLSSSLIEAEVSGKGVTGSRWIIALVINNVLVLSREFRIDSVRNIRINTSELPAGTGYITLFNNQLTPVAERPVFLNPDKKLKIEIKPSALSYNRGEVTTLSINTTDYIGNNLSSVVSVSVSDSTYGYNDAFPVHNIESLFLFENQFWNNLPARIRQNGLFNIDEENLDILLMTYGWRKYPDQEVNVNVSDFVSVDYDYLTIKNPGPAKKTRPEITFTTLEGGEIFSIKKDINRESILLYDTLDPSVRQIMILPDKNPSKNVFPVVAEFPVNKVFIKNVKSIQPGLVIPETEFSVDRTRAENIFIDSAILIEAVTIRASIKPAEVFHNKYQEIYNYASLSTITKKGMTGCVNLEDILVRLNPYRLDRQNKRIYLRPSERIRGLPPPSLIVIDDSPIWDKTYESISEMPASQISSVTALKGKQGFAAYGQDATGGIVFITTTWKNMDEGNYSEKDLEPVRPEDDLMKAISIFRTEAEYYIPKKEEVATNPDYQFRPTIYWNNEILLDGKGPVKITFPNHMLTGKVVVIANGVSFTNMPGAGKASYVIK